jgi:hypothetical protein
MVCAARWAANGATYRRCDAGAGRQWRHPARRHALAAGPDKWVRADSIPGILTPPMPEQAPPAPKPVVPEADPIGTSSDRPGFEDRPLHLDQFVDVEKLTKRRANLFIRHWRGELSLPISYWVMGGLVTFASIFLGAFLSEMFKSARLGPRETGIVVLSIWAFVVAVTLWQVVGIWRSATNHVSRGRSGFWAGCAKFMVVVGVVRTLGEMGNQGAIIAESTRLLVGIDNIPPHEVRVLRDGKELEISGGIGWGTVDDVKTALAQNPKVAVIHLNSVGGRITEAQDLHDLIQSKGLVTYSATGCVSACTLAFLAGKERYIGEGAKIGFHSASIVGDDAPYDILNDQISEVYANHGLPSAFISKAISVDPAELWYPTSVELLSAGVITAVVDSRYYGVSGVQDWGDAYKIETALLKIPTFAALQKHDPKNYATLKGILVDGIKAGKASRDLELQVREIMVNEMIPQYMRKGPDRELIAYWRVQMEEAHYIANIDPGQCVQFFGLDPTRPGLDLVQILPKDLMQADLQALADLITASALNPQTPDSFESMRPSFEAAIASLAAKDVRLVEVIRDMSKYAGNDPMLCATTIAFYDEILDLPPQLEPGRLIRSLLSE